MIYVVFQFLSVSDKRLFLKCPLVTILIIPQNELALTKVVLVAEVNRQCWKVDKVLLIHLLNDTLICEITIEEMSIVAIKCRIRLSQC